MIHRVNVDPRYPDLAVSWEKGVYEVIGTWRPKRRARIDRIRAEGSLKGNGILSLKIGNYEQLIIQEPIPLVIFSGTALPVRFCLSDVDSGTDLTLRLVLNGKKGKVSFWFERWEREAEQ